MGNSCIMIPSRMSSTRFPGKPLAYIHGKPMIQWVWERCVLNQSGAKVVVVSEDEPILDIISSLGGSVFRSSCGHENGSSRIYEAGLALKADHIVNVQGDEPFVDIRVVDSLFKILQEGFPVCTVHCAVVDEDSFRNPNHVKLVCGDMGSCLYFSRSPIPYNRSLPYQGHLVHQGIYGYQFWALSAYVAYGPSRLEEQESLEQLRFLEMNMPIRSIPSEHLSVGVDTPEDIARAERYYSQTVRDEGEK